MNTARKSQLRRSLRERRQQLSSAQQHLAAQALCKRLIQLPQYRKARHIAAYSANDGEISPALLLRMAGLQGRQCYLPRIDFGSGQNSMEFRRYHHRQTLHDNRYGIGEPMGLRHCRRAAEKLDIVLLPLAGFDRMGRRLGMGGGFYDRAFAFKKHSKGQRPLLIGIAHHCQQLDELPSEHWDVPLDLIVTDKATIIPRRNAGKRNNSV
jgi:5-formyltetrahydrofolate cyclo-ligase